jgi:hypothetical protein
VVAEAERGLAMRLLLHSPKDTVAGMLAFAAVSAIIANALFLQAGRHPSPMFGALDVAPGTALPLSGPLPRPRPLEAAPSQIDLRHAEPKAVEPTGFDPKTIEIKPAEPKFVEPKAVELKAVDARSVEPKPADPLANLVKASDPPPAAPSNIARPPAPIPASSRSETIPTHVAASRRVAAVQRALTEYGYGQLKPTGTVGSDTRAAIQKFERDRKLPVSGQLSDRLVRELTAMTDRPID